jgi:hypothetical protein
MPGLNKKIYIRECQVITYWSFYFHYVGPCHGMALHKENKMTFSVLLIFILSLQSCKFILCQITNISSHPSPSLENSG